MNLSEISRGFNAAINEEQAWAICHQYVKNLVTEERVDDDMENGYFQLPTGMESIVLDKDGNVAVVSNKTVNSEKEMIEGLGRVLFEALEFGIDPNEDEKQLSEGLEHLIERMTLAYDGIMTEEDDEGYDAEDDDFESLDSGPCSLRIVIKLCEEHLERRDDADAHYLAVCRALITEAIDLKSFLEKVTNANESFKAFANLNNNNDIVVDGEKTEYPELNFTEWAHLWIQVVSDLRCGVKLKEVEGYPRNVEFELTPYEILMEDIRQRKYTLKKVAVNGDVPPKVKHDAHDIILDFIKSRPTLNPITNRKLRPAPPRSKSLHERLLEQIHEGGTPLRHILPPDDSPLCRSQKMEKQSSITSSNSCQHIHSPASTAPLSNPSKRRLIKAPTLLEIEGDGDGILSDSDSDDSVSDCSAISDEISSTTINDDSMTSPFKRHSVISNSSLRSSGTSGVSSSGCDDLEGANVESYGVFRRNTATIRRKKVLSVSLLPSPVLTPLPDADTVAPLRSSPLTPRGTGIRRAKTMSTVRTNNQPVGVGSPLTSEERRAHWRERRMRESSLFPSEPQVTLPPPTSSPLAKRDKRDVSFEPPTAGRPVKLSRAFSERRSSVTKPMHESWRYPMECLALTVEELIHIRQVLARADLEKYQGRGDLYTNLKKGKICFNCKVRKFSLLWWSCSCQICKQKICSKCMRKVRTPASEYLNTPVYTLSPSLNTHVNTTQKLFDDVKQPPIRLPNSTSTSVLRERNDGDVISDVLRQQYRTDDGSGGKTRKMDVCEECCDLISRIIQNNRVAALQQAPDPRPRSNGRSMTSSNIGCVPYSRPSASSNQFLRRSASSANQMSSWFQYQNGLSLNSTSSHIMRAQALPQ